MSPEKKNIHREIQPDAKPLRIFFFICGIIATIAYRVIFLLNPFWVKIVWYIGTIGFILYFWHRAHVENKRARIVQEYDLINAIQKSDIHGNKKTALSYLIKTSLTSKARYNSTFIVVVSLIALIGSIIVDFRFHF